MSQFPDHNRSTFRTTKAMRRAGRLKHLLERAITEHASTSSFVSTIESEIRRGIIENGRLYASHGKNSTEDLPPWQWLLMSQEYFLPVDEYEMNRIDMNHYKYTLAQHDKLFLAPLPPTIQKILDVGTGTGMPKSLSDNCIYRLSRHFCHRCG